MLKGPFQKSMGGNCSSGKNIQVDIFCMALIFQFLVMGRIFNRFEKALPLLLSTYKFPVCPPKPMYSYLQSLYNPVETRK